MKKTSSAKKSSKLSGGSAGDGSAFLGSVMESKFITTVIQNDFKNFVQILKSLASDKNLLIRSA